ncbi:LysR family transcriptional regulator [Pseudomonas sp. PIC25]|uniref:LysR family transcriptional regulator n=1 Tax=Pseudomonas sp. PIC25 TaxID=1958773 RepID=UPI000BAB466F|nr:LysR family transcriptional regulator [Pseudomonas sp. PIC25]PAU64583.1 LysR family transcriptional regulator [Pseudomonas sp. PIC25]
MFELSQLRCFTTVAMELNFRRAAERLNMTQPPLSRQIQLLEHQLGVALFTRNTRSVTLTAAGRAFLVEAQSLLAHAGQAALTAQRVARGEAGALALGFVASAVYEFLPKVVSDARIGLPGIDIALHEMNTFEQQDALRARRIDLGIVRAPMQHPGIGCECLLREPFVLALPRQHPLASRDDLSVEALHGQPFILYAHSAWQPFNELLTGLFRASGVAPDIVQMLGSTLTILALVDVGMGLTLVPRGASRIRFENVAFRPIDLGPGIRSELYLIWREDNDNPALHTLLHAIRQTARALPA